MRGYFFLVLQKVRYGRLHLSLANRIVLLGGICKAVHYLGENYGVMKGFSYGGRHTKEARKALHASVLSGFLFWM